MTVCQCTEHSPCVCRSEPDFWILRPRRWRWLDRLIGRKRLFVCHSCILTGDEHLD